MRAPPCAYRVILPAVVLLGLGTAPAARAHSGPPFPIVMDRAVGPYVVSVWTHPDTGDGKFWVILKSPPGKMPPAPTSVEVWVQPADRRLPEERHELKRDESAGQVQYYVSVPFETEELWHVRVVLHGSQGGGAVAADVPVTPPGFGKWDLLIYGFPFILFGLLWLCAALRRRGPRTAAAGPTGLLPENGASKGEHP